jgi:hypothetical protein
VQEQAGQEAAGVTHQRRRHPGDTGARTARVDVAGARNQHRQHHRRDRVGPRPQRQEEVLVDRDRRRTHREVIGGHARRQRLSSRVHVLDDAGVVRPDVERALLDHPREVPFRGSYRDPTQVGDVGGGDRDIRLEQHLQDQLFKFVEIHGYVLRLAHAKVIDHGEARARRDHFSRVRA